MAPSQRVHRSTFHDVDETASDNVSHGPGGAFFKPKRMHMRWRQTALGAVAVAAAQNVTCPYILLNASRIFVSGPLCHGHPGDSCIVDNKCTIKRTKISFVDASDGIDHTNIDGDKIGMSAVDAIGDLSYLNTTGFAVVNFSRMNLDAIEFGTTLKDLYAPFPRRLSCPMPSHQRYVVVYGSSFDALDALSPYQGLSGGAIADNGFVVKNSLINQDPALCATACGVVKELWAKHSSMTKQRFTDGYRRQGTATKESTATTANTQNVGIDMSELTLYRLDQQDVIPQSKLASGAFADVLYGTYKGIPVAVKKLLSSR
ncbi:hypothetical protein DYB32_010456, partial [Aphanomyces invadans]